MVNYKKLECGIDRTIEKLIITWKFKINQINI